MLQVSKGNHHVRDLSLLMVLFVSVLFRPVAARSNFTEGFLTLFWFEIILSVLILILVFTLLFVFIRKYNVNNEDVDRSGELNERKMELGWTLGTFVVIIVLFAATIGPTQSIYSPAIADDAQETIKVIAAPFSWTFEFENGTQINANYLSLNSNTTRTIENPNTGRLYAPLVLRADTVYQLDITAADGSPIHSFFVNDLSIKVDAVPGVVNTIFLQAEKGVYWGTCAELCGVLHYDMAFVIVVE